MRRLGVRAPSAPLKGLRHLRRKPFLFAHFCRLLNNEIGKVQHGVTKERRARGSSPGAAAPGEEATGCGVRVLPRECHPWACLSLGYPIPSPLEPSRSHVATKGRFAPGGQIASQNAEQRQEASRTLTWPAGHGEGPLLPVIGLPEAQAPCRQAGKCFAGDRDRFAALVGQRASCGSLLAAR